MSPDQAEDSGRPPRPGIATLRRARVRRARRRIRCGFYDLPALRRLLVERILAHLLRSH